MKKSRLQQIIREEIGNVLREKKKKTINESLSSEDHKYLKDTITAIMAGLDAGKDTSDDSFERLNNSYDAVHSSGDSKLIKAYNNLRNTYFREVFNFISAREKAAAALLKLLM